MNANVGRIITREDGKLFHVGGRRIPSVAHRLLLHDPKYGLNLSQWPTTPSETVYGRAPAAQACLTDILGNDKLGCCTAADQYHRQALRQAAAGRDVFHPTLEQLIATYARDGGYIVGQPQTDQGCDETVVLRNHVSLGIANFGDVDKAVGFLAIDATNRDLVRACATMFVGASVCMGLPDEWINPFPSAPGWKWDVPKSGTFDPANGHCYTLGDQNEKALDGWSWAMPFTLTYDALAAGATASSGGAIYIEVDADILSVASQVAPDGLDWACVLADFNDASSAPLAARPAASPARSSRIVVPVPRGAPASDKASAPPAPSAPVAPPAPPAPPRVAPPVVLDPAAVRKQWAALKAQAVQIRKTRGDADPERWVDAWIYVHQPTIQAKTQPGFDAWWTMMLEHMVRAAGA